MSSKSTASATGTGQRSVRKEVAAPSERAAAATTGLRGNALNLWDSTAVAVSSTAPAHSLAATLGLLFVASAYAGPAVIIVSSVPMFFIAAAYFYLNRKDPNCGRQLFMDLKGRRSSHRLAQRMGPARGESAVLYCRADARGELHAAVLSLRRLDQRSHGARDMADGRDRRSLACRHHLHHRVRSAVDCERAMGLRDLPVRGRARRVDLGDREGRAAACGRRPQPSTTGTGTSSPT